MRGSHMDQGFLSLQVPSAQQLIHRVPGKYLFLVCVFTWGPLMPFYSCQIVSILHWKCYSYCVTVNVSREFQTQGWAGCLVHGAEWEHWVEGAGEWAETTWRCRNESWEKRHKQWKVALVETVPRSKVKNTPSQQIIKKGGKRPLTSWLQQQQKMWSIEVLT